MTRIAVIAHSGKTVGGGLPELRSRLADHGVTDPLWLEVPKSKQAPKQVKRLLKQGADHVFVWGGDGMAQRCIDILAGTGTTMAIIPAGTANLLATNLGIPKDIEGAVMTGLRGRRRTIDVGSMNGERFAVMAGAGFDAEMIADANGSLKGRAGRAAYIWSGTKSFRKQAFKARIKVDGSPWYDGTASCILAGNVGSLFGGVQVFADAEPDDGLIDLAVITAEGLAQWTRTVARTVAGTPERSPFFQATKARKVAVKLDRKVLYELDGGSRTKVKAYTVEVEPAAVTVCVPEANGDRSEKR
jgi:YegS/Rv2252/BmrU family lipid kinase